MNTPSLEGEYTKQAIFSILLGLSLSAVGFFIAAREIQGPLRVESGWPIAVAILVMVVVWLIQGAVMAVLSWSRLGELSIRKMTRVYLRSQAVGGITPFAGGELAYQLLELRRLGLPVHLGGAVITIKSVFNGAILVLGAAIGLIFFSNVPFVGAESSLPLSDVVILLAAVVLIAALWALITFLVRRGRGGRPAERESISRVRQKLVDFLRNLREDLVTMWRQDPLAIAMAGGLMLVYWALYPLLGTLALRSAGWDGSGWFGVYVAQFLLFLVIPFAPTPGNSGAAEVAFVALMSAYVSQADLLGGVLIWRVLNHYSEIILGAFLAGSTVQEDIEVARQEFGGGG